MVSRFWHIKSISDACLKINAPDVLFHKHRLRKPMKESIWPRSCTTAGAEWMYLSAPPPKKKNIYIKERDEETFLWALMLTCASTHTHTLAYSCTPLLSSVYETENVMWLEQWQVCLSRMWLSLQINGREHLPRETFHFLGFDWLHRASVPVGEQ